MFFRNTMGGAHIYILVYLNLFNINNFNEIDAMVNGNINGYSKIIENEDNISRKIFLIFVL
jgi:hypothetical protein